MQNDKPEEIFFGVVRISIGQVINNHKYYLMPMWLVVMMMMMMRAHISPRAQTKSSNFYTLREMTMTGCVTTITQTISSTICALIHYYIMLCVHILYALPYNLNDKYMYATGKQKNRVVFLSNMYYFFLQMTTPPPLEKINVYYALLLTMMIIYFFVSLRHHHIPHINIRTRFKTSVYVFIIRRAPQWRFNYILFNKMVCNAIYKLFLCVCGRISMR